MFQGKLNKANKTCVKPTFWRCEILNVKVSVWREAQKSLQNRVKHTILDLGHALLTYNEATRIHKPHECHPEGSREHLRVSFGTSGNHLEILWELLDNSRKLSWSHLGVLWELSGDSWEPSSFKKTCFGRTIHQHPQPSQFNHKTSSFSLAWRNARSRLNKMMNK